MESVGVVKKLLVIQKHLIKFVSDAEKKFKDMDIKTLEKFFMRLEMGLLRKTIQYMIRQFKEEKNKTIEITN